MYNITILLKDTEFEHDVFELTRAFFPEASFSVLYSEEEMPGDHDLLIVSDRSGDEYRISYESGDKRLLKTAGRLPDLPDGNPARKQNKDIIKSMLYELLSGETKRTLPWGDLTGIRPAKLATEMLENGSSAEEAKNELMSRYMVGEKKACLAAEIAVRELELLSRVDCRTGYSLYVGIPFCPSICLYCSFSSFSLNAWSTRVDDYLTALEKEIAGTAALMRETKRRLNTIYIGGGTPTSLNERQMDRLLRAICSQFDLSGLMEFTVEAGRPDSITEEKLKVIHSFPVTRISVNPQTMNQKTLDLIGRKHTVYQTEEAFRLARRTGFDNINMDLIVGLPGEEEPDVRNTLEQIRELSPESMTVHSLAVKRSARLNIFRDLYQEMTFENNQKIIDLTIEAAGAMKMAPYYMYRQKNMKGNFENVGYARAGKECLYNILIMEQKEPIIALGAGGSTKFQIPGSSRICRIENVKDVAEYITRVDEMTDRKRTGIMRWLTTTH